MRLRPPALHHGHNRWSTIRASGSAPGCLCGSDLRPSIRETSRAPSRAPGSAPGCSCGSDLRPSITGTTAGQPSGPPDLRLAAHAAPTSGPPSRHGTAGRPSGPPDLRLAAHAAPTSGPPSRAGTAGRPSGPPDLRLALMRLRPPALDRPVRPRSTVRASGSAPGCSCGSDLRPSIARATAGRPSGPPDLRLAAHGLSPSGRSV